MIRVVVSGFPVLLTFICLAGCQSRTEGDASKKVGATKDNLPKQSVGGKNTSAATNGGVGTTAKGGTESESGKKGDTPIKTATELTRLERKGFVIFYKGFSEEQMEKLADLLFRQGTGKEPRREFDYGLFSYQAKIAKSNQGMRIVREDDFTTIMVPVEPRLSKSAQHYSALVVGVLFNLHKIDESVRGKSSLSTCNNDWSEVYLTRKKK
ncbi:MAG TPA: hypothetical protein VH592_17715 [Gemmataceae bacterium]|jgi:hypothetical protein